MNAIFNEPNNNIKAQTVASYVLDLQDQVGLHFCKIKSLTALISNEHFRLHPDDHTNDCLALLEDLIASTQKECSNLFDKCRSLIGSNENSTT